MIKLREVGYQTMRHTLSAFCKRILPSEANMGQERRVPILCQFLRQLGNMQPDMLDEIFLFAKDLPCEIHCDIQPRID